MRKLLLLSIIGLLLIGCDERKITNDYFVGEWLCNDKSYHANMENGKFTDYIKGYDRIAKMTFKMENNELYFFNEYKGQWIKKDMANRYSGETFLEESDEFNMKVTGAVLINSDDELQMNDEILLSDKSQNSVDKFDAKIKFESICTRIQ